MMSNNKDFDAYLAELYKEKHSTLEKFCFRYCNYDKRCENMAEDWVQDAFLTAAKNPEKLLRSSNRAGWLAKTCKNIINNYFRRKKTRIKHSIDTQGNVSHIESKASRLERWATAYAANGLLREIVTILTKDEKAVYDDYFVKEMPIKQVSKKENKTVAAIKSIIHRIRSKGRKVIKNFFDNFGF